MTSTSFEIKKLVNNVGYTGAIELSITILKKNELQVEFDSLIPTEWRSAIAFGATFFSEHFLRKGGTGFKMYVEELRILAIDTTQAVVFYITVKCLCKSFEFSDELIKLDETGHFIIAK